MAASKSVTVYWRGNHAIIAPFQHERTNFYSICYFRTLIRFVHFVITLGEELLSLPPLTARHWFFIIQIFEQLSCPEKQSCPETFNCFEIFFIFQDFWATCGLPWKTECVNFCHSEFWTTCACPEKQNLPWNFSLYWNIFYLSGYLSNLCLPWKQSVPWINGIECIFYPSEFWTTCACPEKQNLPWDFSLYWNIFYLSGFLRNLSLPWKQSLPWFFQTPPPPRTPLLTISFGLTCRDHAFDENAFM